MRVGSCLGVSPFAVSLLSANLRPAFTFQRVIVIQRKTVLRNYVLVGTRFLTALVDSHVDIRMCRLQSPWSAYLMHLMILYIHYKKGLPCLGNQVTANTMSCFWMLFLLFVFFLHGEEGKREDRSMFSNARQSLTNRVTLQNNFVLTNH